MIVRVAAVERAFVIAGLAFRVLVIADHRLRRRHERARHEQEIVAEHPHQIDQRGEMRRGLAALGPRGMHLRQADPASELARQWAAALG